MKYVKSAIHVIALTAMIFAMYFSSHAWSKSELNKKDFTIKVGKSSFDLLTQENYDLEQMTKKKFVSATHEDDMPDYAELKAAEATFITYLDAGDSKNSYYSIFVQGVNLTKKGSTARGIKIGSSERELFAAYPEPTLKNENLKDGDGKAITTYVYFSNKNVFSYTPMEMDSLKASRPLEYYGIEFAIDAKTKKVVDIYYFQKYAS